MASFRPAHDDHATDAVIFQLVFDAPLGPDIFAAAEVQHGRWRDELPALQRGQPDPVKLPGFLALPPQSDGVSFTHLRPDGLPAWQVRFDPGSIGVICTRYIRWERVWKTARRYLGKAIELVVAQPGERQIAAAMLQFADRFDAPASAYDAGAVLRSGGHLPATIFGLGAVWHNNMGWFGAPHAQGQVLNNLNLASNMLAAPDAAMQEERVSIGITHIQELRLDPPLPLADPGDMLRQLDRAMEDLYRANRALAADILVPDMAARIGIGPVKAARANRAP